MTPQRRHEAGGMEVVQIIGLLILIGFIYRHFGPGAHSPVTPSVIAIFAAGLFLVVWPMLLKAKP
jgi:hypothetical protein